jgi:hypothetical protein
VVKTSELLAYDVGNMSPFQGIDDAVIPAIAAAVTAILTAILVFGLALFVGARVFVGESSYGIPMMLGLPAASIAGVLVFIFIFRKLR